MTAGATLTIDLGALAANYRLIRQQVSPAQVAGVVKADGYGLGAALVARTLIDEGCRHFCVALLGEAAALVPHVRGEADVFVLNGLLPGDEAECATLGAIPVLNSLDQIELWSAQARARGRKLPAMLQFDTGMSRMGLSPEEIDRLLATPDVLDPIDVRFLISHLACADDPTAAANAEQAERFRAITAHFPGVPRALDNSGGSFLDRGHFDLVRAGIALYGGAPRAGANPMHAVVALEARIAQLRTIPAGTGVGYGLTFRAERETRIATIQVGYADGWPRCLGNRGAAYIGGVRAPIAGRVSMDSITLDVTDVPAEHLFPGAPVELVGPHQSIDDVANDAGTISYEILTQLSRRYDRIVVPVTEGAHNRSLAQ
ncbi:alanine racemase [Novosphingobium nitrogenifigens DSM 19370]|uniref:Alanine racemase n=1 Tax=Novosphingobium nitrogenifigens DSM 19370 TaxID=983920 RepID=F1ZBT5_9SPHN|nr:alanine racemase [Novosphingobium nitrogenifigens]EGD57989.1 alanine racemase [Novosphingobium nitrogenifigens DSM 19370]